MGKPHNHALWRAWLVHKADRKLLRRWCDENSRIGASWWGYDWLTKRIGNYSAGGVRKTADSVRRRGFMTGPQSGSETTPPVVWGSCMAHKGDRKLLRRSGGGGTRSKQRVVAFVAGSQRGLTTTPPIVWGQLHKNALWRDKSFFGGAPHAVFSPDPSLDS